ncbi:hypothetical protein B0T14DRAFT_164316 [Immersiella caudata]|uniref:Uncharacterized protein n=1 Tax=Immersiella caudata TaxID=314043 RepID=A0AA39WX18_9PEZI|nr:hypothetical protein B0T14DRAFT_164316 [Immersiella caudata]
MMSWGSLLLLASTISLSTALPTENPLTATSQRGWDIICRGCTSMDYGTQECQAGTGGRNHAAFLSPSFSLPCTTQVDRSCSRPGIQDCVHGSELPEEVLYWSEHPEDVQHSFTPLGTSHRARLSALPAEDPVAVPKRRVLEFKCYTPGCHDRVFPYQLCHLETEGEQNAKITSPPFLLECETAYERYCTRPDIEDCVQADPMCPSVVKWSQDPENFEH